MAVDLKKGVVVCGYKIIAPLSSGGEGDVYRAQRPDGTDCALKQYKFSASDLEFDIELKRVMRRKELIGKRHSCVAETLNVFTHRDLAYEVCELVEGASLESVLADRRSLPVTEAGLIFNSVLDGLAWLHDQGIVHRDIKPGNIMVMPDGGAKLIDLGIILELGMSRLTARGAPCTPIYAPIEVICGGEERIDGRSDLYSVGVTLYETLAGKLPFPTTSKKALIEAKSRGDIEPPDVPEAMVRFINRLLQVEPEDRHASAREAREALNLAFGLVKESDVEITPKGIEPVYTSKKEGKETGAQLRVLSGPKAGSHILVPREGVSIGRWDTNPDDRMISRIHARFTPTRYGLRIRAQGALNGIVFDDKRVRDVRIASGQEFVIGITRLRYENDGGK
jgi:eukaryotic-like serine/threonine-protein kinase